jgi:hypothetical protein
MEVLVVEGVWVSPGTVNLATCPSCRGRRARLYRRPPYRPIPLNERGISPTIAGDVLYLVSPWESRSGLTWHRHGASPQWWATREPDSTCRMFGSLLRDPKLLVMPASMSATASEFEAVIEEFQDKPPPLGSGRPSLKRDGPFEVRVPRTALLFEDQLEYTKLICTKCLDKEVEASAAYRQGHLTIAPIAALSTAAMSAIERLLTKEPSANAVFNHTVHDGVVRADSGRVAIIESSEGTKVTSPDHPDPISLPPGRWVAVHPWPRPSRGVD